MNLIIKYKKSNEVHAFLKDVIQKSSKEFVGSNGSIVFKPELFDLVYTIDEEKDIIKDGIIIKTPTKPVEFKGKPVSSKNEVNRVVKEIIREKFSIEDELKANRLQALNPIDSYWIEYATFIQNIVQESNNFIITNNLL